MKRFYFLALILLLGSTGVPGLMGAPGGKRVEEFSDPARLVFEGCQTFTRAQLLGALHELYDFRIAAHPAAPLADYLEFLEKRLLAGYQHCGFLEAGVRVRPANDGNRIVATITEGKRYFCGAIRVSGAKIISPKALIDRLGECEKTSTNLVRFNDSGRLEVASDELYLRDCAHWLNGRPAHGAELDLQWLASHVTNVFTESGCLRPEFTIRTQSSPNGAVDLLVDIKREGPRGTLADIEISGNKINRRETILRYLDLKPGQVLKRDLVRDLEQRLWHSARFLKYQVNLGKPDLAGKVNLKIALVEYNAAPPLDRELTPVQQALVKARDWLVQWEKHPDDLLLSLEGGPWPGFRALQFCFSPQAGWLAWSGDAGSSPAQIGLGAWGMRDSLAELLPLQQRKYSRSTLPWEMNSFLEIVPNKKPDADNPFYFTVGAGFRGKTRPEVAAVGFRITIAPAAAVHFASKTNFVFSIKEGILSGTNPLANFRVETGTGRLHEVVIRDDENTNQCLTIKFVPGAFRGLRQQMAAATSTHREGYDAGQPLSSFVRLLAADLLPREIIRTNLLKELTPEQQQRLPGLVDKILASDFLGPLAEGLKSSSPPDNPAKDFVIPEKSRALNANALLVEVADGLLLQGDHLFEARTWPWMLMREIGFVLSGQGKYTEHVLAEVHQSEQPGPLAYYLIAYFLSYMDKSGAAEFASRGAKRLDTADFQRDYRTLLQGQAGFARSLSRLAAALRDLDEGELELLAALQPYTGADFTRKMVKLLHARPDNPLADTLAPLLDEYWEKSWKKQMREALTALSRGKAAK